MNFDACKEVTRKNARSFYFASFPLPIEKRNATFAMYAFCRTADDIVDEAGDEAPAVARERLNLLRAMLDGIEKGQTPDHPLWGPLAASVVRFGIPVEPLRLLLDGVESDLEPRRFETFAPLRDYCYQVASTVGLALSHIFGFDDRHALDYAANMGIAMQLTNIARDIGTDYKLGRIYVPLDEMERFGYSEKNLASHEVNEAFRRLMEFQVSRAREYYRRAFQGIRYLTRDGSHWTAFLMGDVYRAILGEIEKNQFDVFTKRASITTSKKVALSATALLRYRREVLLDTKPLMSIADAAQE